MKNAPDDRLSEVETVRRSEAALKRMLSTPHKPDAPLTKKRRAELKTSRVSWAK
jgi:hypothetical protein